MPYPMSQLISFTNLVFSAILKSKGETHPKQNSGSPNVNRDCRLSGPSQMLSLHRLSNSLIGPGNLLLAPVLVLQRRLAGKELRAARHCQIALVLPIIIRSTVIPHIQIQVVGPPGKGCLELQ